MGASTKCGTAAHAGDIETWPGTARRSGQASWKPAAASARVAGQCSNASSSTPKHTGGGCRAASRACARDHCAPRWRSRCSAPLPTGPYAPRARHGGTAAGKKPSPPREIPVAQSSGGPRGRPRARRPHPTNELLAGLRKWGSTTRCRWKRPPATLQSTEDQARARRQFRPPSWARIDVSAAALAQGSKPAAAQCGGRVSATHPQHQARPRHQATAGTRIAGSEAGHHLDGKSGRCLGQRPVRAWRVSKHLGPPAVAREGSVRVKEAQRHSRRRSRPRRHGAPRWMLAPRRVAGMACPPRVREVQDARRERMWSGYIGAVRRASPREALGTSATTGQWQAVPGGATRLYRQRAPRVLVYLPPPPRRGLQQEASR